jgi:hypothetical protein
MICSRFKMITALNRRLTLITATNRHPNRTRFFPLSQMSTKVTKRPKHRRVHSASSSASHTSTSSNHLHPQLYPSAPASTMSSPYSDNVTVKAASRILNTVRRSFNAHKKRDRDVPVRIICYVLSTHLKFLPFFFFLFFFFPFFF